MPFVKVVKNKSYFSRYQVCRKIFKNLQLEVEVTFANYTILLISGVKRGI